MELEIRPVFLVPDTNGFIDHLGSLVTLLDCRKFILVVPLIGERGQHEAGGLPHPPGRAPPPVPHPSVLPHVPAEPVWSAAGRLVPRSAERSRSCTEPGHEPFAFACFYICLLELCLVPAAAGAPSPPASLLPCLPARCPQPSPGSAPRGVH